MPARIPSTGFENDVRIFINAWLSRSPSTEVLMALMPVMRMAKPISISPTCCFVLFLQNIRRKMPMTAIIPVSVAVETI